MIENWIETTRARAVVESSYKWRERIDQIPAIQFPSDWEVRIIPPFGGAIARFQVLRDGEQAVSVYLDFDEKLGCWDGEYWEIYPYDGDVWRCNKDSVDELVGAIQQVLDGEDKHEYNQD